MAGNNFRSDRGRDPLAELARLIGQADLHGETAPADNGFREETASHRYDEPPGLSPARQGPGYPNALEQAYEPAEHRHDERAYEHAHDESVYDADDEPHAADDEYGNEAPRVRRRSSLALVMAIFGLAVVGTAGAFGYRAMFGGSVPPMLPPIIKASKEPNKIAPTSSEPQASSNGNASQAGAVTTGSITNLVSREEQPVTIEPPKPAPRVISTIPIATGGGSLPRMGTQAAPTPPLAGQAVRNEAMPSGVAATDSPWPHPATTARSDRAGQSGAADVTAESSRAPMAAATNAAVAPSASGGGYAVQVLSERSESKAQAAFRALQAKYPNQLRGRQWIVRRADLGAKGTYYRALVGPFASAEKAAALCSGLKAAGGNCLVQKN